MHILKILLLATWFEINLAQEFHLGSIVASITTMTELLSVEQSYISTLESYGNGLLQKRNRIRSALEEVRLENDKAMQDPDSYLAIPTNVFALIRRMHQDWPFWEVYLRLLPEIEFPWIQNATIPTTIDFDEAATGLNRVKRVYKLKARDLAAGIINGKQYDSKLSAWDCFGIATGLIRGMGQWAAYHDAVEWINVGLEIFEDDFELLYGVFDFSRMSLYRTYIGLARSLNISTLALRAVNTALDLNPQHTQLLIWKNELDFITKIEKPTFRTPLRQPAQDFEAACRGDFVNRTTKLYCLYNTTTTPFLKLAPIKMELISLDPYLVVFHDILYDEEITTLMNLSRPILARAGIGADAQVTPNRVAKHAWLEARTNNVTLKVFRRMEDMTGFKFHGLNQLQVQNYGLAGYYFSHHDYFEMNDVEQGGATAFPVLDYAYFPKKGTAVLWYNLNERLERDNRTLHAGCPVMVGSKWAANQWIREYDQMFTAPCYDK